MRSMLKAAALVPLVYAGPILVGLFADFDEALASVCLLAALASSALLLGCMVALLGGGSMKRRGIQAVLLSMAGYVALVAIGLAGGCGSSTLPKALSESDANLVARTHFDITVAVEPYEFPAYSQSLERALRDVGLFESVVTLGSGGEPPDVVARVEKTVSGTAALPLFTALSAGVVPCAGEESVGHVFSLHTPDGSRRGVSIDYRYHGRFCLGWVSGLLNLSRNRARGSVKDHPRFHAALGHAIAKRATGIRSLYEDR